MHELFEAKADCDAFPVLANAVKIKIKIYIYIYQTPEILNCWWLSNLQADG